jgi:hypothetical protein
MNPDSDWVSRSGLTDSPHGLRLNPGFYRACALLSVLSAVTTLALIFLPRWFEPASGFEGRMARVHDPVYQLRAWIYLLHPFLVFAAALAVALRLRFSAPGLALAGLAGFALWGMTEAAQQTLTLFAFDRWREDYLAGVGSLRSDMALRMAVYDGLWNAAYALLLIGFLIGNICYCGALARGAGLSHSVAVLYGLAALLTLALLLGELRWPTLPDAVLDWAYPLLQPLARVLIGVWLWQHSVEPVVARRSAC